MQSHQWWRWSCVPEHGKRGRVKDGDVATVVAHKHLPDVVHVLGDEVLHWHIGPTATRVSQFTTRVVEEDPPGIVDHHRRVGVEEVVALGEGGEGVEEGRREGEVGSCERVYKEERVGGVTTVGGREVGVGVAEEVIGGREGAGGEEGVGGRVQGSGEEPGEEGRRDDDDGETPGAANPP
ncbi:hypothetical protein E2562_028860 [Oryza meyeriana var. granulata]|uniref:Uncharacterized protein n=1 Tax=Oryza meyeriana var. granulata TaxID=110450 RepID=A0A6G1FD42_9ORYZ|nr:hypothetical protein E2562_028860 [Oryza meyeriana var. granulata]